jgi:hypothetical protein
MLERLSRLQLVLNQAELTSVPGHIVARKAMVMDFVAVGAADIHRRAIPLLIFSLDEFISSLSLVKHCFRGL